MESKPSDRCSRTGVSPLPCGRTAAAVGASSEKTRFDGLIREYNGDYRSRIVDQESWFAAQPTLRDAIRFAALARIPGGKKSQHQWRLKNSDLGLAEHALLAIEHEIARSPTFDQLYELICCAIGHIWKAPELYGYDTALRIGARLHLKPDKVYLHRGTRVGARRLGLASKGRTLDISRLPQDIRKLSATELEDFLCIFKDRF